MKRNPNYHIAVLLAAAAGLSACSSSNHHDGTPPPPAANTAPAISAINDKAADQDTVVPVEFGITDNESALDALTLTVAADSNAVFPTDGIVVSGSGATRTLTLTPLESATGSTNFTVSLADPQGLTTTRTFKVDVNAKSVSIRQVAVSTFAKTETDDATAVNGLTFEQDADDPAIFEPLVGDGG